MTLKDPQLTCAEGEKGIYATSGSMTQTYQEKGGSPNNNQKPNINLILSVKSEKK